MNRERVMSSDRLLRFETATHLKRVSNTRDGLFFFRKNPQELSDRIQEFDSVIRRILERDFFSGANPDYYRDAIALRHIPGGIALPKLASLSKMAQAPYFRNSQLVAISRATIGEIGGLVESEEWQFPKDTGNPGQLASGLLIEGYGLLLERYLKRKGIARAFVLAFEEVLWKDFPNSKLLKDVLPWMIKEKDDFPPRVRNEIEDLVTL